MNQGTLLHNSLKTLVNQRSSGLSRKLKHTKSTCPFNPYNEAISEALLSAVRKEVLSAFEDIFGSDFKRSSGDPGPGPGGRFGTGQMEVSIDQMVAEALMHGRQTSGTLRVLFGLVPVLIGR